MVKKLWKLGTFLRILPGTLWFNFRHLPFKQAVKLPIFVYKAKVTGNGKFIYEGPLKLGAVRLGFNQVSIYPNSGIKIENRGRIVLSNGCHIGNDSYISVGPTGLLVFDEHSEATAGLKLACYSRITLQKNVLIGWDCLISDTDFHRTMSVDGRRPHGVGPIEIGEGTWVANGCRIYKNSVIPRLCVIGAGTSIHGKVDCAEKSLITNDVSAIVRREGIWLDRRDDKIVYSSHLDE